MCILQHAIIRKHLYDRETILLILFTSSGARAMRGFGAMCLLWRSRCVFLAPQCAAFGWVPFLCLWCVSLFVPVVRLVFLFTAHVQQICTTVQYCSTVRKKGGHEPRTKFHLIYRISSCSPSVLYRQPPAGSTGNLFRALELKIPL